MEMYGQCRATQFYLETIDNVLQNVTPFFYEEGYDDEMLEQLKGLWLNKLQTGKQNSGGDNDSVDDVVNLEDNPPPLDAITMMALASLPQEVTSTVTQSDAILAQPEPTKEVKSPQSKVVPIVKEKVVYESEGSTSDTNDSGDDSLNEDEENAAKEQEEANMDESSLNSEDDLTDDGLDNFTTDNLIMCQYSKIIRVKNKWRFNLSHGIMFLNGEEYVFSTAKGETQW